MTGAPDWKDDFAPSLEAFAAPYGMFGASVDEPRDLEAAYAAAVAAVKGGRTAIVNVLVNR